MMNDDDRIKALEAACAALEKRLAFAERRINALMKHGDGGGVDLFGFNPFGSGSSQQDAIRRFKESMRRWVDAIVLAQKDSGATVESVRSYFVATYPLPEDAYETLARASHGLADSAFPEGTDPAMIRKDHETALADAREHAITWADIGFAP